MACAVVMLAASCGEPTAGVLATWVDAEPGVITRSVQVYDDGERYTVPWQPDVPGSGTSLLQLGVDARGAGVALSGRTITYYQGLRDLRKGWISDIVDPFARDLESQFRYTAASDAILRGFVGGERRAEALLPLTSRFSMEATLLQAPDPRTASAGWLLASAADAPILFWIEQSTNVPLQAGGVVQAVAYPSELGHTLGVAEPTVLATGELHGRGTSQPAQNPVPVEGRCDARVCISPSGRVLSAMPSADVPCAVWLWSWEDAVSPFVLHEPTLTSLPAGCPQEVDDRPHLFAQIEDDVLLYDDRARVYVVDLGAGTVRGLPKIENVLRPIPCRRGHAMLLVSVSGTVTFLDASGPRLLNTERTACPVEEGLVASPSGNWVVRSCSDETIVDGPPVETGTIVRISVLGVEQYTGIPMRPLAVDDDGNALLYSYESNDGEPRGLFVLRGDGQLSRVDDLEPPPAPIMPTTTARNGRFSSAPIVWSHLDGAQ